MKHLLKSSCKALIVTFCLFNLVSCEDDMPNVKENATLDLTEQKQTIAKKLDSEIPFENINVMRGILAFNTREDLNKTLNVLSEAKNSGMKR